MNFIILLSESISTDPRGTPQPTPEPKPAPPEQNQILKEVYKMNHILKGNFTNVNIAGKYYQYGIKPEATPATPATQTIQYIKPLTRPHPQTGTLHPQTMQDLINILEDYTEDPETIEEVIDNMKEINLYKPVEFKFNIFEFQQEAQEIERTFIQVYEEEQEDGLQETGITPEQYKYFFTALFKKYLQEQIFIEIKQDNLNLFVEDEFKFKAELEYYILNDITSNTAKTLKEIIYNLFTEDTEILEEIRQFIYLNSIYAD